MTFNPDPLPSSDTPTQGADWARNSPPAEEPAANQKLWQVPLFLVGVATLVLAWMNRPAGDGHHSIDRELRVARDLLGKPESIAVVGGGPAVPRQDDAERGRLESVMGMVAKVLPECERWPRKRAEALYLLGTAELRLADHSKPLRTADLYKKAHEHLQQAAQLKVGPKDEGPLQYRLAKAAYHTGEDPARVAEQLAASKDLADDAEKPEAYSLLTQAYLRLPEPNYRAALDANQALRTNISLAPESILIPARLLGGKLLLQLKRTEEARKVLAHLSANPRDNPVPAAILAEALLLRAQSFHDEGNFSDAANLWSEALGTLPAGNPERTKVLFDLGYCQRRLGQLDDAKRSWEEVCQTGNDELSQAAAFFLAQMYLQAGQLEPSLARIKQAVQNSARPEDWKNTRVPLKEVREFFEAASQEYRKAGNFALATELAALYPRVAPPERVASFEAETAAEHGRALRADAQKNQDIVARAKQEDEARRLLAEAGQAYVKAAAVPGVTADQQTDKLWLAASCYREVPDNSQVIAVLWQVVHANPNHARTAEGWYLLGEAFRMEKKPEDAERAYVECYRQGNLTPFAYRGRYQHSVLVIEQGGKPKEIDDAESDLEKNLRDMTSPGGAVDPEAYEKTLFTLGSRLFQQRRPEKYTQAAARMEEFLHQFPANPQAPRAQFQLAESYREIAIDENRQSLKGHNIDPGTAEHHRMQYRTWMSKAADEYYQLATYLDKPENANCLTDEERIRVQFQAADCRFNLGRYDEALKLYNVLADRFKDRTEGLNAIGGSVRCLSAMGENEQMKKRLGDLRTAVQAVQGPQRTAWEDWIRGADKP